ncbi:Proline racemase [Penicillium digitatum]|uniref:trans-L-3-hydroxyproline dehydratase n=3 Tax=Penicillium digitatum TaxID=36651 RepID=K9G3B2_PEND2|nr:hypothetical protein PDIP_88540 [Penicillium digitatum Pd1]EKV04157.1 hypothetical protein PDIP_88540 [Penicillium digitatum Pd1]EKV16480.1 hypothetical protein PDIG_20730 [Penicillium digitatum PHI26]QQK42109.1 Proline racemase [Penicillium digitatum]
MLEPRGHYDMYGAILRPDTELVNSGKAHMGVLFMHNELFSLMCGHATIALGRFLVDVDEEVFPRRKELRSDPESRTTTLSLHVQVPVPEKYRWAELRGKTSVTADFAYGGAYYCMVSAEELGFPSGLGEVKLPNMDNATKLLKEALVTNPDLRYLTRDIRTAEEGALYGIMITDTRLGHVSAPEGTAAARAQLDASSEET